MKKRITAGLMALLLAACSSAPTTSTQGYLLTGQASDANHAYRQSQPLLAVPPVSLASLLTSNGIVYQTTENSVVVAQNNLWAEDLSGQLTQRLFAGLRAARLPVWPVPSAAPVNDPIAYTLLLHIDQFNGSYTGNAQVTGTWTLLDGNGELVQSETFHYQQPLEEEGYPALVDALSVASDKLITDLTSLLGSHTVLRPAK